MTFEETIFFLLVGGLAGSAFVDGCFWIWGLLNGVGVKDDSTI